MQAAQNLHVHDHRREVVAHEIRRALRHQHVRVELIHHAVQREHQPPHALWVLLQLGHQRRALLVVRGGQIDIVLGRQRTHVGAHLAEHQRVKVAQNRAQLGVVLGAQVLPEAVAGEHHQHALVRRHDRVKRHVGRRVDNRARLEVDAQPRRVQLLQQKLVRLRDRHRHRRVRRLLDFGNQLLETHKRGARQLERNVAHGAGEVERLGHLEEAVGQQIDLFPLFRQRDARLAPHLVAIVQSGGVRLLARLGQE